MTSRRVDLAFGAFVLASAWHFADNAQRFDRYHDADMQWLTPTLVVAAWFVQTAIGIAGLVLHHQERAAGRPILMVYAALGFAGVLHYVAGMPDADAWMHAAIALEGIAGAVLLAALVRTRAPGTQTAA